MSILSGRQRKSPAALQVCRRRKRSGQALVEFALILPILLALLMGIMEFGFLMKNQLQISNATREGARAASLGKSTTEIKTRVKNTSSPLVVQDGQITIYWSNDNGADNYPYLVTNSGTQNGVASGKMIRVQTAWPHTSLTGFFPFLNNRIITIQVTMRREAA